MIVLQESKALSCFDQDPRVKELERFEAECDAFQESFSRAAFCRRSQERQALAQKEVERHSFLSNQFKEQCIQSAEAERTLAALLEQKLAKDAHLQGKFSEQRI